VKLNLGRAARLPCPLGVVATFHHFQPFLPKFNKKMASCCPWFNRKITPAGFPTQCLFFHLVEVFGTTPFAAKARATRLQCLLLFAKIHNQQTVQRKLIPSPLTRSIGGGVVFCAIVFFFVAPSPALSSWGLRVLLQSIASRSTSFCSA